MLSLSTLTNIETQAATQQKDHDEAKQNALLALSVAIGELQKYLGPDSRTTARANLNGALIDNETVNGNWVGAYGRSISADYNQTPSEIAARFNSNIRSNGSQAVLLNWLVSGNEDTDFILSRDVDPGDGFIINAPSNFAHIPSANVDLRNTLVQPSITDNYALLLGSGSVEEITDRVAAPLVKFSTASDGQRSIGRYAWWVGDEGAKARINLPSVDEANRALAFVSAQKNAVDLMSRQSPSPDESDIDRIAGYDLPPDALAMLHNNGHLPAINSAQSDEISQTSRYRYHDITTHSNSVLADSFAGGLKKDLSALLSSTATLPANDSLLFTPSDEASVINPIGDVELGVPTWGQLRSFAGTHTSASTPIQPQIATDDAIGISPVITYSELAIELIAVNPLAPSATFSPAAEGDEVALALYPKVVLWNPYTQPMAAQQYELTFMFRYGVGNWDIQVEDSSGSYVRKARAFLNHGGEIKLYDASGSVPAAPANDGLGIRFVVDVPEIPAGQSYIFSLNGSEGEAKHYEAALGQQPQNVLSQGLDITGRAIIRGSAGEIPQIDPSEAISNWRLSMPYYAPGGAGLYDVYLTEIGTGLASTDPLLRNAYQAISSVDIVFDSSTRYPKDSVPLTRSKLVPDVGYWTRARFTQEAVIRWLAQSNPRTPLHQKMHTSNNVNGKNASRTFHSGKVSRSYSKIQLEPNELRASSGKTVDSSWAIVDTTLFEFRPEDQPLLSLGQLQHANLSMLDAYPAYPFGNSYADYRFKSADGTSRSLLSLPMLPSSNVSYTANYMADLYDVSWLLNHALWDRYFFSTVPHAGTGTAIQNASTPVPNKLPNPRHVRQSGFSETEIKQADTAAAAMLLEGGFNVNSTSEQAWRAVLGGINDLAYDPYDPSSNSATLLSALSRFAAPSNPDSFSPESNAWVGYRQLSDTQIDALARAIVEQVRLRGPFISVADFVNRRLHDSRPERTATNDLRLKGALQAAIDSLHDDPDAINLENPPGLGDNPFDDNMVNGHNSYGDVAADERADRLALIRGGDSNKPTASGAAMAPQFLTQADILSAIGAGLTARSDTFVIRTYGETQSPLDGTIVSRAWCEAIVQRRIDPVRRRSTDRNSPDYFEPALATVSDPDFGRQFEIVSFRWLSPEEI